MFCCQLTHNNKTTRVKINYNKISRTLNFITIEEMPRRFLCFSLAPKKLSIKITQYEKYSFSPVSFECWQHLELRAQNTILLLSFNLKRETVSFLRAINTLHNEQLGQKLAITAKKIHAKILAARLCYLAKKKYGMSSAPLLLIVGMLNHLRNYK
jgi:hypothetical protein